MTVVAGLAPYELRIDLDRYDQSPDLFGYNREGATVEEAVRPNWW